MRCDSSITSTLIIRFLAHIVDEQMSELQVMLHERNSTILSLEKTVGFASAINWGKLALRCLHTDLRQ